ncbi:MAG: c-type cytochrome [Myxococcota bacterium]|nr:c-type cytochrome [Myxococcota bacterium]
MKRGVLLLVIAGVAAGCSTSQPLSAPSNEPPAPSGQTGSAVPAPSLPAGGAFVEMMVSDTGIADRLRDASVPNQAMEVDAERTAVATIDATTDAAIDDGASMTDAEPIIDAGLPEADAAFEVDLERGAQLYTAYCGFCHGPDGEGYAADNANALGNPDFLASATDEFIEAGIVYGRPGTPMSAWGEVGGGPLDANDVRHLVAHIRAWDMGPPTDLGGPSEGVASRGEAVYAVYCSGCHGDEGEGVTAMSLNNPRFLDTASDGFIRHAIVAGRRNTPMAAYSDVLTDTQIEDVVALIRSWARPVDEAAPVEFTPSLEQAILNPEGLAPDFALRDDRFVPADQVKLAMDQGRRMVLLDTRLHGDYLMGHITGAVSMPFVELENFLDQLPRDTWIINYCGCPHAISGRAFDAQQEAGFTQIAVLDEGYYVWAERQYPVTVGQASNDDVGASE